MRSRRAQRGSTTPSLGLAVGVSAAVVASFALAVAVASSPAWQLVHDRISNRSDALVWHYGLVGRDGEVTPTLRCVARRLRALDERREVVAGLAEDETRPFFHRVCETAAEESLLLVDGVVIDQLRFAQIEQQMLRPVS